MKSLIITIGSVVLAFFVQIIISQYLLGSEAFRGGKSGIWPTLTPEGGLISTVGFFITLLIGLVLGHYILLKKDLDKNKRLVSRKLSDDVKSPKIIFLYILNLLSIWYVMYSFIYPFLPYPILRLPLLMFTPFMYFDDIIPAGSTLAILILNISIALRLYFKRKQFSVSITTLAGIHVLLYIYVLLMALGFLR